MITKGKTGTIHGIEVKARSSTQRPSVHVSPSSADGKKAVLKAAQKVYDQHRAVIQALANR